MALTVAEDKLGVPRAVHSLRRSCLALFDQGHMITEPLRIAKHYFRSWFAIDLVSSFPYHLLVFGGGQDLTAVKILRVRQPRPGALLTRAPTPAKAKIASSAW